jgi:hypothetical protein
LFHEQQPITGGNQVVGKAKSAPPAQLVIYRCADEALFANIVIITDDMDGIKA